MRDKREFQPILNRFQRRRPASPSRPDGVSHELAIVDEDNPGYDPYDRAAPVSKDVDAEQALYRRRKTGS